MRVLILAATLLVLSCPWTESALPPGPEEPARNLAQLDAFADRVQREALHTAWLAATAPETSRVPAPFGVKPMLLLRDSEVRALNARLRDPRQSQCLQAIHSISVRMQSEADFAVANALAEIAPLRQQLPDLGSTFTDEGDVSRRKDLWASQAAVARKLEPVMRRLIAARNAWAQQRSGSAYLELMREHRGYDARIAERLESEVRRALSTNAPKRAPWEFELIDPPLAARMAMRFDAAHCLERASFVFRWLGLPEKPAALQMAQAKQTPFSSFAFYPVDPPRDQRLTVREGAGIVPHWSAFHEFGHAAMALMVVPGSCRTLDRPVSPAVSESCAKIAERLFYSEEWLRTQNVPPSDIAALRNFEKQSEQMRMRSILDDLAFERLLYRNPAVESGGDFPAWTLKRHLAYEPLARMDYLLARCAQAAVYRRLRKLPGGLLGEPARRVLREEVFRGATAMRYEEWFRRAAGEEPNCDAWLRL